MMTIQTSMAANWPLAKPHLLGSLGQAIGTPPKITMAAVSVKELSKDAIRNIWGQKGLISWRIYKKGLHCAREGYVQNLNFDMVGDKIKLEARGNSSDCRVIL